MMSRATDLLASDTSAEKKAAKRWGQPLGGWLVWLETAQLN
jgi:hypothetical protein